MSKVYVVAVGKVPGIYHTWEECKVQVDGVPGAKFKKFNACDTAAISAFLADSFILPDNPPETRKKGLEDAFPSDVKDDVCVAYTDGSYNAATAACGIGLVFFHGGQKRKEEISQPYTNAETVSMRNVAAEIYAVLLAVQMAEAEGAKKLIIYHDYIGLAEWVNGGWQAKNTFTQMYRDFVRSARETMAIEFRHVDAHTGDTYNELADALAKAAVGL